MGSRIREKPNRMFEFFLEITKVHGKAPSITRRFPDTYSDEGVVSEIPKFAFPCETDGAQVDHFSFVVPDLMGMFRFGFCRHATGHQTCLCVVSWLPWFDTFYKMLDHVSKLTATDNQKWLIEFLEEIYDHDVPGPKVPVSIIAGQQMFNFTAPDPSELPKIPGSINLTEYYNALDAANMIIVFASMLQERRIYMMSKRLNRLTSCIHAAEALLYPLNWQHTFIPVLPGHVIECLGLMTPYIIGVHGNLISRLDELQEDLEETVFVDLDTNTVTTEHDDLNRLPWNVVSALKKDLKAEKLKDSMQKTGDAISMAFLKAIVRLIGGYKDALKMRPGEPVTFDEKLFIHSRPSHSFHVYLEGMLSLQLFQEFIQGRIESLNAGVRINDIFEQQVVLYAERHGKKKNKSNFKDLKVKAAPTISTAVHSIKKQSRRAISTVISGLMVDYEDKKGDKLKDSSESLHTKIQQGTLLPALDDAQQKMSFQLGPPKEKTLTRPSSAILTRELSQDDSGVSLSYQSPNMSLLDDLDIQEILRKSPSSEILSRQDRGGLSSSSSSSSLEESDNSASASGSVTSLRSAEATEKRSDSESGSTKDKLIRPNTTDKLIKPKTTGKDNDSKRSTVKSSPLSRLLSTRRNRNNPTSVATRAAVASSSGSGNSDLRTVKDGNKPAIVASNIKSSTDLPAVPEGQKEESVLEGTLASSKQAGSSTFTAPTVQEPLIVFDSNEGAMGDAQFDPLADKPDPLADKPVGAKLDSEQTLVEALQFLPSQNKETREPNSDSGNIHSLDAFGSMNVTDGKSATIVVNAAEKKLKQGETMYQRPNFTGIRVNQNFYRQRTSQSPQHGFQQSSLMGTTPTTQIARGSPDLISPQLSPLIQPTNSSVRVNSPAVSPGMSAATSPFLMSTFKPHTPGSQLPPSSATPHALASPLVPSPLRPTQINPDKNQVPVATDFSTSGTSTISSVFAARARDSRAAAATGSTTAIAKSQADLLSDLIGVDFGSSNSGLSQPQQLGSLRRSQPK